jgi:hypothetical protein
MSILGVELCSPGVSVIRQIPYALAAIIALAAGRNAGAQQTPRDSASVRLLRLNEQAFREACAHKPGARLRLYGCALKENGPEPVYVIDGRELPTDTTGPGRLERESALAAIKPGDVHSVVVVNADSTRARTSETTARMRVHIRTRAVVARDSAGLQR